MGEDIFGLLYRLELVLVDCSWGAFEGTCKEFDCVGYAVLWSEGRLCKVGVSELDGVGVE